MQELLDNNPMSDETDNMGLGEVSKQRSHANLRCQFLLPLLCSMLSLAGAHAQIVWTNLTGTNRWTLASNWSPAIMPTSDAGAVLSFINSAAGGAYAASNDVAGVFALNSITFAADTSNAAMITLLGNPLAFTNTGAVLPTVNQSGCVAINNPLTLGTDTTFNVSGTITVSGPITGPGALIKTGAGLLALVGNNSFSGCVNIAAGTLRLLPGFPAGTTLMPLGASITDGFNGTHAGYRGPLYQLLHSAGYAGQFVGDINDNPGQPGDLPTSPIDQTYHCGHSGWTTSGILLGVTPTNQAGLGWYTTNPATVVLLHIGTNNTGGSEPQAVADIRNIITTIHSINPSVTILLAQLIPKTGAADWINAYNDDLATVAAQSQAAGINVVAVNMNLLPPAGLSSDGVHPNDSGYAWMAQQWFALLTNNVAAMIELPSALVTVAAGATLDVQFNQTIGALAGAGTVNLGSSLTVNSTTDTTFTGVLQGSAGFTKTGTGTLTLTGYNSYTGPMTIVAGTLAINGQLASSQLTIQSGAQLTGTGTIAGSLLVDSNATVQTDFGGTLLVTGSVTNYGTMRCRNGTTLAVNGPLVNLGVLDVIDGTSLPTNLVNHGVMLTAASVKISQLVPAGSDVVLRIQAVSGHLYQLQFADSLAAPAWTNVGVAQAGTGAVLSFTDPGAAVRPQRFYRIAVGP